MRSDQLAEQSRAAALELQRLGDGDLRGMFDGPRPPASTWRRRWSPSTSPAVHSSSPLGVLMACAAAWLHRALTRPSAGLRILVVGEGWAILRNLGLARSVAAS